MAAQGQSNQMESNTEGCMKPRRGTEFFHAEIMAPTDIHLCLLNTYGDQTAAVSTVRRWVLCFSRGNCGSLPVVQTVLSAAHKLLFITGKNAQGTALTTLKKCFVAENVLHQSVVLLFPSVAVSVEINKRHYFQSSIQTLTHQIPVLIFQA